jgi:hypothetical protein
MVEVIQNLTIGGFGMLSDKRGVPVTLGVEDRGGGGEYSAFVICHAYV